MATPNISSANKFCGILFRHYLSSISLVLMLLFIMGITSQPVDPRWGDSVSGCRVGVSFPVEKSEAGQPLDAVVEVQNITNDKLMLFFVNGSDRSFVTWDGTDPDGKDLVMTSFGTSLNTIAHRPDISGRAYTIGKGETFKMHFRLNQLIDMSRSGDYKIHISVYAHVENAEKNGENATVIAPELHVEITDPAWKD